MCGIVGLFAKSSGVEERLGVHLAAMLAQMSDRGPDSAGVAVYRDPAPPGACKLSIYSADPLQDWAAVCAGFEAAFGGAPEPRCERATLSSSSPRTPSRPRSGCAGSIRSCA